MRKLATAALAFSAAIFLANYGLPIRLLPPIAATSAALGLALMLLRRKWLRPVMLVLLFFSLGLFEFWLFSGATTERAKSRAGETGEFEAVLLDFPDEYAEYCRCRVRITSGTLRHCKAIVYDNDKLLRDAEPGQRILFTAKIGTADSLYGKPYDQYNVNGFYYKLTICGDAEWGEKTFLLSGVPVRIRQSLCRRADSVFPQDTRAFLKALMLGDKQDFYEDDALYVAMSRSGMMHIIAVSGLHIAFLVGLLRALFGRGKSSALLCIVLIWFFVLIVGMPNSAVRAAFMQSLLLLAPILRRENDPITSLSAILALILAVNPLAARSVSLQLSFAAMGGIVIFFEKIYRFLTRRRDKKPIRKLRSYAAAVLASSLSVLIFTVPLTALHFSYVALLSFLCNLACLWAVSLCFCLTWAACALAALPIIGTALVWLCTLLARYILFCAGLVSALPFSVLYMKTEGAFAWMLFTYVMLGLGFLLRRKKGVRVLLPAALSLSALLLLFLRAEHFYRVHDAISVLNVGQGQCITAFAGETTAVIDCGNTFSLDNAGAIAGEYLAACGRKEVDLMLLTHLHADHADGTVRLMEMLPVRTLIMPADASESGEIYNRICSCAQRRGTEIVLLDRSAEISSGRMLLHVVRLDPEGKENERCLMAELSIDGTSMLVTADAPKKLERKLLERVALRDTDILIAGHHGSKYACSEELLRAVGGRLAVISVGYNPYNLPAEETLARLERLGYQVMRTDRDGTIEILAG